MDGEITDYIIVYIGFEKNESSREKSSFILNLFLEVSLLFSSFL